MKTTTTLSLLACFAFVGLNGNAQNLDVHVPENDAEHPCFSVEQYQEIEAEILKNKKRLGLDKLGHEKMDMNNTLQWPLRPAANMTDCGYFYISAFVDMNPVTGQTQDYNCGSRTYDGHRGVDIVGWPFIWDKMDNNQIEVIAAAPGIITAIVDGNPDHICNGIGGGSTSNNYISIQHADGSMALYAHMKTGSLTNKIVGDAVEVGEYLGVVGSAGQSTGPHLHFEIRSDGTFENYVDPFFGNCNADITSSLWENQTPYSSPEILKASIHNAWPYMGVCPVTQDTLYEETIYTIEDQTALFGAYTKHVTAGDIWNFEILNPDNSVFSTWSFTSMDSRNASSLAWEKDLPNIPGIYTYLATFNGTSCSKQFEIQGQAGIEIVQNNTDFSMYPNPSTTDVTIYFKEEATNAKILIYDQCGKLIQLNENITGIDYSINRSKLNNGIYFISVQTGSKISKMQKLILTN